MGSSGRFQRFQTLHCYRKSAWQEVLRRPSCQTEMRIQHPHQPFFCCMCQGNFISTGVLPTQTPGIRRASGRSARRSPAAPRGSDLDESGTELRPSPQGHRASLLRPLGFWASTAELGLCVSPLRTEGSRLQPQGLISVRRCHKFLAVTQRVGFRIHMDSERGLQISKERSSVTFLSFTHTAA